MIFPRLSKYGLSLWLFLRLGYILILKFGGFLSILGLSLSFHFWIMYVFGVRGFSIALSVFGFFFVSGLQIIGRQRGSIWTAAQKR